MIVVHSTIPLDPDRLDEAKQLVASVTEQSREEDGTIRYRAMVDLDDRSTVRFFEQYEDKDAWDAHTESAHYQKFMRQLPTVVDGQMETVNIVGGETHVHHFTADELTENSS